MTERSDLLMQLSNTIADYRQADGIQIDSAHIDKWICQFDEAVQIPILKEVSHVLRGTYIPQLSAFKFLQGVFNNEDLTAGNPKEFWPNVEILNIQKAGASQRQISAMFKSIVEKECGQGSADFKAGDGGTFLYLDDGIFTGNRVKKDLEDWLQEHAPNKSTVHIVVMALHRGGQHYARGKINAAASACGKKITVKWWRIVELEDRKAYTTGSDVLRPVHIPQTEEVLAYVQGMVHAPVLRTAGSVGGNSLYSSDANRQLLETEFLKAGVHIRNICPHLGPSQRPLGHMTLETLGFGSLIVTFRNCPNNAPLAFWAGDPWYPLFPRSTNSDTSLQNFLHSFGIG